MYFMVDPPNLTNWHFILHYSCIAIHYHPSNYSQLQDVLKAGPVANQWASFNLKRGYHDETNYFKKSNYGGIELIGSGYFNVQLQ